MKERPILFSGPMVRAILDGSKTQTRRVVKPQPEPSQIAAGYVSWKSGEFAEKLLAANSSLIAHCPFGVVGDRLWVREAWAFVYDCGTKEPYYRADGIEHEFWNKWKPSIHMPRWASRLTLEITDVRVQRLQDISEDDCYAEGYDFVPFGEQPEADAHGWHRHLWNSINAKSHPWESNPFVWAISFEVAN